jgi:starch phosphorylase
MSSVLISNADARRIPIPAEDENVASLRKSVIAKLTYAVGRDPIVATDRDWFMATALAVRDHALERWMASTRTNYVSKSKRVYYLSLEFLIGRLLHDSLNNLGLVDRMRAALAELGVDYDKLRDVEHDAALGNGGLGRLAACFMESMATLGIAAHGYGIRYNHGMFRQVIRDGWQWEFPENWLAFGNPWEVARPDATYHVGFGGTVETQTKPNGEPLFIWHSAESVDAVAYDTPIIGWRAHFANTLRLWAAWANDTLRLDTFNRGDHIGAQAERARANAISQVLYPSDDTPAGQELRLRQEYFFTSASLQDIVARHMRQQNNDIRLLPEKASIQLNDTHPAIAVAELMRILIDLHDLSWDDAWQITTDTISYTNHTLLPEALESWPAALMERLLPRHMQIVYQINRVHLDAVCASPRSDGPPLAALSLIDDAAGRRVRMSSLAFLGSHKVNGVSELHTNLMRETVFRELHQVYPDRIVNKTNGVTFRRWLIAANPELTRLLTDIVGNRLLDDANTLSDFAQVADDTSVHERLTQIKRANKQRLAKLIADRTNVECDPDALFDVQIKRIHEYKRQLLNILETIALYNDMRDRPTSNWVPRVKIFAGKAAASYRRAKLIIKLINDVATIVNSDPGVRGMLKVVFLPDYNVSLAETIIPAADLSEQISTAGMEASGTGNMKLALNGALTIGTLDGANVEIRERVGEDNIFIFGLTANEANERRHRGPDSRETIAGLPALQQVLDAIRDGVFSPGEPRRFAELIDELVGHDHFLVTADFATYAAMQAKVSARWGDQRAWSRSSALNIANVGWFSSDRAIREYAAEIWNVTPRIP